MKRFPRNMLVGLLSTMLALLLLTAGGASAASSTCGAWRVVKSPNVGPSYNVLQAVAAVTATNVWAVGQYISDGVAGTLIEQWNGTHWRVVSSPNIGTSDNSLSGVAAVSANNVWAVGDYFDLSSRNYQTLTEFFC